MAVLQESNGNDEKRNTSSGSHSTFAKLLAGNDKKIRDKGLKKLKKWFSIRSLGETEFSEDEFKKIWVGLFYSMWMSDLHLVQEELAESLSSLVHCFNENNDAALLFIKCFNNTMATTWSTLDQYRIDKFSMLVRRFLRQSLTLLEKQGWPSELVTKFANIYSNEVLSEKVALGFKLHFMEVFLEELAKVSKGELPDSATIALIKPFAVAGVLTRDGRVRVQLRSFFEAIIKQTEVALEYEEKFHAWKEAGCPGGDPDLMVLDSDEDDDDNEEPEAKETTQESELMNTKPEPGVLDPRAGSVHVSLPQIRVPFKRIISLLKKIVKLPHATLKGKRMLLALSKQFRKVEKGKYPLKIGKIKLEQKTSLKKMVDSSIKNSIKQELKRQKKRKEIKKKLKKRKNDRMENGGNKENTAEVESKLSDKIPKEKDAVSSGSPKKISNDKVKSHKRTSSISPAKKNSNVFNVTDVPEEQEKSPLNTRKRKNSDCDSDMELPPGWIVEPCQVATHKTKKPALENWKIEPEKSTESNKSEKRSPKKDDADSTADVKKPSPKKSPPKGVSSKDPESSAVSEESKEVEITVSPKKIASPPAFFAKAFAKAGVSPSKPIPDAVTPISKQVSDILNTSKSGRRISFNLAKNMSQEKVEWFEQIERSPQIPFDASKVPRQSALKAGLSPSPINPFYARKLKLTTRYSLS